MTLELREYQKTAHSFAVQTLLDLRGAGLLVGCGLGKTIVTLKAIDTLRLLSTDQIESVLIAAPMRVVDHWLNEHLAWNTSLPVRVMDGPPKKRLQQLAQPFRGITVVTHACLSWLAPPTKILRKPRKQFDMLVIDEGSKFRDWSAKRVAAGLRIALRSKYRLLLTGTPCPNHTGEIFAQQALIDKGLTLGKTIGGFRDRFMFQGEYPNEWYFRDEKQAELQQLISPYYLHQSADLLLGLPDIVHQQIKIKLPPAVHREYKRMEAELIAELKQTTLLAFSGSDRYRLCRQLASGMVYDQHDTAASLLLGKKHHVAHTEKLEAIHDLLPETDGPVMIAYQFTSEREELLKSFAAYRPQVICGGTSQAESKAAIKSVQDGTTKILLVQSQSVSHGIDGLQHGCNILVWFTLPDSGEVYEQLIARLHRSGQTKPVIVYYPLAVGTIDVAMLRMLQQKQANQENLLRGLSEL